MIQQRSNQIVLAHAAVQPAAWRDVAPCHKYGQTDPTVYLTGQQMYTV